MKDELPDFDKIFFIHYQCDDFTSGEKIHSLSIIENGKEIQFSLPDEAENIKNYCNKINELQEKSLRPVHWGQCKHHFGEAHIKNRYKDLTGEVVSLKYKGDINLSAWLKNYYGEKYITHPRLDNLALLNNFNTEKQLDKKSRTYASDRVKLISKIYFNVKKNSLITKSTQSLQTNEPYEIEELHNNIFKGKAIFLFKEYVDSKDMTPQSRTDFRFLYEQMKKDNLIYDTVSLSQYIKFIQNNFGYVDDELKTINPNTKRNIQRERDYLLIKDNLKMT